MTSSGQDEPQAEARLTFVTVAFEGELTLMLLQARSMALYLPPEMVDEILVIDNSARGFSPDFLTKLNAEYGRLAASVRVVRASDVVRIPPAVGWWSQQVLKVAVASRVTSQKYVILDAKNHFVAMPSLANFVSVDGRARVNTHSYRDHRLRPDLENVLRYLNIDESGYIDNYTAVATPFVMDSVIARELVAGVELKSGKSFAHELMSHGLPEFFLYTGWVIASGRSLDEVYDVETQTWPIVWPHDVRDSGVTRVIGSAIESGAPLFAVHRRALGVIDEAGSRALAEWWFDRGLFPSVDEALFFITEFQSSYASEAKSQKRRELRGRLARAPRVIAKRIRRALH
jgi:hypothetical protein